MYLEYIYIFFKIIDYSWMNCLEIPERVLLSVYEYLIKLNL